VMARRASVGLRVQLGNVRLARYEPHRKRCLLISCHGENGENCLGLIIVHVVPGAAT
jgi:hypothetical protein